MAEAFGEAAQRHWSDASLLEREGRHPNADHLFGVATECALKAALLTVSAYVASGRLLRKYQEHIDVLWDLVPVQNLHKRYPNLVALLRAGNTFSDWKVDQRYEADSAISEDAMSRHRDAAKRILGAAALLGSRRGS